MATIIEKCEKIITELGRLGLSVSEHLRPGLSPDEILEFQSKFPFQFPQCVVDLYQWTDGIEHYPRVPFPEVYWGMMPLNECWERYSLLRYLDEPEGFEADYPDIELTVDDIWRSDWLPLFGTHDVSTLGIHCSTSFTPDGEISYYENGMEPVYFRSSLSIMFDIILAGFTQNAYYLKDGLLYGESEAMKSIPAELDPGYPKPYK